MNRNCILTTREEVAASHASEYLFPTEDMTIKGTLDSRSWGQEKLPGL